MADYELQKLNELAPNEIQALITDYSALTRSLNVHWLLGIFNIKLWKEYIVKKWLYYADNAVLSPHN